MSANKNITSLKYIDVIKISKALEFSDDQVHSLLKIFVRNVSESFQALIDAVKIMNEEQIKYHSHTLLGLCGSMQITPLYELLLEIESSSALKKQEYYQDQLKLFDAIFKEVKREIDSLA